ncbi:Membrane protein [Lysobacter dokdonensis DS-58]|uniref:SURF1-like protein n=1 Tax=Lysobacter dokdonensis DS-58 TaxID=1300345 RepID=A0A0A2WDN0_9GAMM|nr:SURF1 family protein [Lysobacter dokdonensis]KGQ18316.1 Membrane protein [Lysobacter dokdonensis DS-58]
MSRRGTFWFGWALALVVMALFARLGFWQYARMQEKQALLADVARALHEEGDRGLESDVIGGIHWLSGEAEVLAPTLLLDNQMHDGRAGVRVYCIVQPDAAAPRWLVDFGWTPVGGNRAMPAVHCPTGRMRIRGLSVPTPSSGLKLGAPMQALDRGRWLMVRLDPDAIYQATKISQVPSYVLKLDPVLKTGWTRDLDVLPNTLPPERHLGYAVQWWALCLAVFTTALVLSIRKKKRHA